MSLSIIGSVAPATSLPQHQNAAPAPVSSQPSPASSQPDTVTISAAAQKALQGGDVDHDGDSH
jgi:hypothetical protein